MNKSICFAKETIAHDSKGSIWIVIRCYVSYTASLAAIRVDHQKDNEIRADNVAHFVKLIHFPIRRIFQPIQVLF